MPPFTTLPLRNSDIRPWRALFTPSRWERSRPNNLLFGIFKIEHNNCKIKIAHWLGNIKIEDHLIRKKDWRNISGWNALRFAAHLFRHRAIPCMSWRRFRLTIPAHCSAHVFPISMNFRCRFVCVLDLIEKYLSKTWKGVLREPEHKLRCCRSSKIRGNSNITGNYIHLMNGTYLSNNVQYFLGLLRNPTRPRIQELFDIWTTNTRSLVRRLIKHWSRCCEQEPTMVLSQMIPKIISNDSKHDPRWCQMRSQMIPGLDPKGTRI